MLPALSGGFSVVLGASVIYGWLTRNIQLIQVFSDFPQMRFNTALCFVLMGISLFGLTWKREQLTLLFGIPAMGIALLTLLQYFAGLDLGIDNFFYKSYLSINNTYPGRMAPNTAIGFTCLSIAMVCITRLGIFQWGRILSLILSFVTLSIALISVFDFQFHLELIHQWLGLTQMAFHTGIGLVSLSIGFIALLSQQGVFKETQGSSFWQEATVFFLCLFTTLFICNAQVQQEQQQLILLTDQRMQGLQSEITNVLLARIQALKRIARRWEFANGTTKAAWEKDVSQYITDQPDYHSITWVDSKGNVQWTEAKNNYDPNPQKLYHALSIVGKSNVLSNNITNTKGYNLVSILLPQNQYGVMYCIPLNNKNGRFDGHICGVYNVQQLMTFILKDTAQTIDLYIFDKNYPIYNHAVPSNNNLVINKPFNVLGLRWQLQLQLGNTISQQIHTLVPLWTLLAGITLSVLSAWMLYSIKQIKYQADKLHQSEERHRLAIAGIKGYAIFMLDINGKVISWNDGAEQLKGYTQEEIIGQHFSIFYPKDLQEQNYPDLEIAEAQRNGQYMDEGYRIKKDGSAFWANVLITPIYNEKKQLEGFIKITHDLTEQKRFSEQLRQSQENFKKTIDNSAIGMATVSLSGTWLQVNPALSKVLGYTETELLEKTFQDLTHPDDLDTDLKNVTALLNGDIETYQMEKRYCRKDGTYLWAQLNVSLVFNSNGQPEYFIAQIQDIDERRTMEEEIKDHARKFEAIFNQTYQFIGIMSPEGIVLDANKSALKASGTRLEDVIGHYFWDTPWWSHSIEEQNKLKDAVKTANKGEFVRFEATHPAPDGTLITVDFSLKPIKNDQNKVVMLVPEGRDITHIKEAEQKLERATRTLKDIHRALDMSTIVAITDRHGDITYANEPFYRISKYTRDELIGRNHNILNSGYHPREFFKNLWRTISKGDVWHGEIKNKAKDGSYYWVDTTIVPLVDEKGAIDQYVAVRLEITAKKQLEESLLEAKQLSEQASKFKSEFLASMSHEIRTPMNGILGMTEIALNTDLTTEQRHYLEMVHASGTALLTIINDILDFSKIEAGKLELDPIRFKLRESIVEMLYPFTASANEKGIELLCNTDARIPNVLIGDITRIRQVLINLIGNALKFTHTGEIFLGIELRHFLEEDIHIHFWVKDTGIGMSNDQQNRIFSPFTQADNSTTRKYGGTGLGLSISNQLVALMDGRLWVESKEGAGSTFHFSIPLKIADEAENVVIPVDLISLINTKVLIVDDNHTNLKIVEEMVKQWQMIPTIADSAQQALECMENAYTEGHPFKLVLSDYGMPQIDGYKLARQIKDSKTLGNTKVIILSSYGQAGEANLCRVNEIEGYLSKPISQTLLLSMIRNVLGNMISETLPKEVPITRHEIRENRQSLQILLAEDNEINQAIVLQILTDIGHRLTIAKNGIEALTLFQKEHFDIVLMDAQMPEMDGYEATLKIREWESNHGGHIPIIALTANAIKGDRARCLSVGMDSYLSKPFKRNELINMIDAYSPSVYKNMEAISLQESSITPFQNESLLLISSDNFNYTELMDRFNGNITMLKDFYEKLCKMLPDEIAEINAAITNENSQDLYHNAHRLKGSIGIFTTGPVYHLLQSLEQAGFNNDFKNVNTLFSDFKNKLVAFHDEITQLINNAEKV